MHISQWITGFLLLAQPALAASSARLIDEAFDAPLVDEAVAPRPDHGPARLVGTLRLENDVAELDSQLARQQTGMPRWATAGIVLGVCLIPAGMAWLLGNLAVGVFGAVTSFVPGGPRPGSVDLTGPTVAILLGLGAAILFPVLGALASSERAQRRRELERQRGELEERLAADRLQLYRNASPL